ncbi:MAG: hypothetical protein ACRDJP_14785 [Actinomycetota bacterium]
MRRPLALLFALVLAAIPVVATASTLADPPTPDPNFLGTVTPVPCTPEPGNPYEEAQIAAEGWDDNVRYPGACQRLRFRFGPIPIKPGQNDVLVQPVTIEKPGYDGYITRFDPDLVRVDGTVPPIDEIHLHHATWLSVPTYGSGPFFAAGEEKTIATFPKGYGMPIKRTDAWALLYMIHSAIPEPDVVFITYDVDYIAKDVAEADPINIKPAYSVWLDVESGGYPVFNTQRQYADEAGTCTYPAENCADFDAFGNVRPSQGLPSDRPGADLRLPAKGEGLGAVPNFQGGTLIGIGGHLHPGGLRNEVDVVRAGEPEPRRIYTSDAVYWDRQDSSQPGGPPTSWDFSMTVTGLPRWGVHLEPGDILRSNATYDTTNQSTYENMGIVVALIAPDDPKGNPTAPGVNPFDAPFDPAAGCPSGGLSAPTPTLCDKGVVTHPHLAENDNFGGPEGDELDAPQGDSTNRVDIAAFLYNPGDLSTISMGIPTVPLGSTLKFFNEDALIDVYHSATSCAYPCTGRTGTAFPLGNGRSSAGRDLDFDSGELGFGLPAVGAAKQSFDWDLEVTTANGFQPGEIITYYCRIHPFMRGAFEVAPA